MPSSKATDCFPLVAGHGVDELAEYGKLEPKLNAVHDAFEGGFDNVIIGKFNDERRHIYENDETLIVNS